MFASMMSLSFILVSNFSHVLSDIIYEATTSALKLVVRI